MYFDIKWKKRFIVWFSSNFESNPEDLLLLLDVASRLSNKDLKTDIYKAIINFYISNNNIEKAEELLQKIDDVIEREELFKRIQIKKRKTQLMKQNGGGGYKSSPKQQRQTKQNSDSSTGLLGLGAVAVGVFLVVLLGVRYRK